MKTTGLTIVNPLPLNYTDVAFTTVSRKIIAKVGFALLLGAFNAFHVLNMTSNTRQTACERSKRNHMLTKKMLMWPFRGKSSPGSQCPARIMTPNC